MGRTVPTLAKTLASSEDMPSSSHTFQDHQRPLVVIIAGSTGVGKSDVAAKLSQRFNHRPGIIISADSVQAYRGVEIGANKPTVDERRETPHLLIDVADSKESYNAAEWMEDATYAIKKLLLQDTDETLEDNESINNSRRQQLDQSIQQARISRNYPSDQPILPLIVGGTMMYIQWLVYGRPDAPSPTLGAVQRAEETIKGYQADQNNNWAGAVQYVRSLYPALDAPVTKLFENDWYRLRRILEVAYTMKEKGDPSLLSKLYSGDRGGGLLTSGYDVRCFFLCPHDRMHHTQIIDERCESMLVKGLFEETCNLVLAGELPDMAAKAIGYRQVLEYLRREEAKNTDHEAFSRFLEVFTAATRQYARRQVQWFRKDDHFVFVPVDLRHDKSDRVLATASEIDRMISLSREDFDEERLSDVGSSKEARRRNEEQAKGMKTYMFRSQLLKQGSSEMEKVLKEADECTTRLQSKLKRIGEK